MVVLLDMQKNPFQSFGDVFFFKRNVLRVFVEEEVLCPLVKLEDFLVDVIHFFFASLALFESSICPHVLLTGYVDMHFLQSSFSK